MKRLAAASLLLFAACKPLPELPGESAPYAQAVAGLTLVFIDPELPGAEQAAQRLQVRVDHVSQAEDGSLLVRKEMIRGLDQPFAITVRLAQGGVAMVDEQGKVLMQLLPEGFPDRVSSWEMHGTRFTVIGRAAWGGASLLPSTTDPVGVWVEARPPRGLRTRSLYLKGFGEVETQEERPGGKWVCVNRLQQQGYLPTPAPEAVAPPPTAPKSAANKPAGKAKPKRSR